MNKYINLKKCNFTQNMAENKYPLELVKKDKIDPGKVMNSLLIEVAWEVCNQVGGIYTVIRSKVPTAIDVWSSNYCLIGPFINPNLSAAFDPIETSDDIFGQAVRNMRNQGYTVHYGSWLITGRPRVVLFDIHTFRDKLSELKYFLWKDHDIGTPEKDELIDDVVLFGHMVYLFFKELALIKNPQINIIGHFHEWMAGIPIPKIRKDNLPVSLVFTTHATLLGRYLAMNDTSFYENLPFYDHIKEARHYNIETQVRIERAAAHGCQVFTTVSEVTSKECFHLLGRKPDLLVPNGINIERFTALHEFQNMHFEYKEKIHQFVMAHFFHNTKFDLDNTIYFFTSGRFEYHNKGFDLTLEALSKLNWMMKQYHSDKTVVMFFVTKQPYTSINPVALQSRAIMEELRQTCLAIQKQVGERLFFAAAAGEETKLPNLNDFVDDYWKLRYRRLLQSWHSQELPLLVTHNLTEAESDPILKYLQQAKMFNSAGDKVKIVYHPDFISSINPLFGMEYGQFIRGCHMGIFPSYYEPWGYTPLECIASGVPAITSDLSGFGDYVIKTMPYHEDNGIAVINRHKKDFDSAASQIAYYLFSFLKLSRRERIELRNKVDSTSVYFDWNVLYSHYENAYNLALNRNI
ncbi:MAG: glycosyltransferase [Candidatus Cyclobacteriaceae bacterium M3_2C_046]